MPTFLRGCWRRAKRSLIGLSVSWKAPLAETFEVETEYDRPDFSAVVELSPRLRPQPTHLSDLTLQAWSNPSSSRASPTGQWDRTGGFCTLAPAPGREGAVTPQGKQRAASLVVTYTRYAPAVRLPPSQSAQQSCSTGGASHPSPSRKRCYAGADTAAGACGAAPHKKAWSACGRGKANEDGCPAAKKKRPSGRRVCLACDLGRKRRCTCGKRTRR